MTTEQIMSKVSNITNEGRSVTEALKQLKITPSTYYYHKAKAKPGTAKVITYTPKKNKTILRKPGKTNTPMTLVQGTPEQLAEYARNLQ